MNLDVRCNHIKKPIWTVSGRDEWQLWFSTEGDRDMFYIHTDNPAIVAEYQEGERYTLSLPAKLRSP